MDGSEIVLLVRILCEIEEFNAGGKCRSPNELPIAVANGSAEWLDAINNFRPWRRLAFADGSPDIHSVQRFALVSRCTGEFGQCRIHVHSVHYSIDGAARLDMAGPISKSAHQCASFVKRAFAIAIRTVITGNLDLGYVGHLPGKHRAARATVVALKDDEGVVPKTFFVECRDNAADLIIHARHHGRIGPARRFGNIFVAIDVLLRSLIGSVRRVESEIEIER